MQRTSQLTGFLLGVQLFCFGKRLLMQHGYKRVDFRIVYIDPL